MERALSLLWTIGLRAPRSVGIVALVGALGAVFFLFVFPSGSISTLMHHVLNLPGPGAGIALILGPVALTFMFVSQRIVRGLGGALLCALCFSVTYSAAVVVLELPTNEKGQFGTIWFILALAFCGITAEGFLLLTRNLRTDAWRFVLTACGANVGLLVFYWLVIFPRTAGWVSWNAVPVLLLLSLVGGLIAGSAGLLFVKQISKLGLAARR